MLNFSKPFLVYRYNSYTKCISNVGVDGINVLTLVCRTCPNRHAPLDVCAEHRLEVPHAYISAVDIHYSHVLAYMVLLSTWYSSTSVVLFLLISF